MIRTGDELHLRCFSEPGFSITSRPRTTIMVSLEMPRRHLSLDTSLDVCALPVVENSSFEICSRGGVILRVEYTYRTCAGFTFSGTVVHPYEYICFTCRNSKLIVRAMQQHGAQSSLSRLWISDGDSGRRLLGQLRFTGE